jgi:flagellar hook-length control protein FliK
MKVTTSNNSELSTNKKIDNPPAGSDFDSSTADGLIPGGGSEKSDFANVLERVTRSHDESTNRQTQRGSDDHKKTNDSKPHDDDDKVGSEAYLAGKETPLTRESGAVTDTNTDIRPILHTADLDSIVKACHVQLAASGQHEVTLELSRSMLDGLRVKVSSDGAGRITADFLAANDGIKTLLDNRSNELIEQLRSRGINLAEFKSSVAADSNSRNDSGHQHQPTTSGERRAGRTEAVASLSEPESITDTEEGRATGATYRG